MMQKRKKKEGKKEQDLPNLRKFNCVVGYQKVASRPVRPHPAEGMGVNGSRNTERAAGEHWHRNPWSWRAEVGILHIGGSN